MLATCLGDAALHLVCFSMQCSCHRLQLLGVEEQLLVLDLGIGDLLAELTLFFEVVALAEVKHAHL